MKTSHFLTEQNLHEVADDNKNIKWRDAPNRVYKVEEINYVRNGKYGPIVTSVFDSLNLRFETSAPSHVLKMINKIRKQRNLDSYTLNKCSIESVKFG